MASLADNARAFLGFGPSRTTLATEAIAKGEEMQSAAYSYAQESIIAALNVALEQGNWREYGSPSGEQGQLSFQAVKKAADAGRALVLGNPIMTKAAQARAALVFGEGLRITGADGIYEDDALMEHLLGIQALTENLTTKVADGNLFFVYGPGGFQQRIPFYQIVDALLDPEDDTKALFYLRKWTVKVQIPGPDGINTVKEQERSMLYVNSQYKRGDLPLPETLAGIPVYQYGKMRHLNMNKLVGGLWGYPDLMAGIFYAAEHKELIAAGDSIYRAQSEVAVEYTTKTQKALAQVAASILPPIPEELARDGGGYGQTVAHGDDMEMKLTQKIGAGIDFTNFDSIANLASVALDVPVDVVLGAEPRDVALPATTKKALKIEQKVWIELLESILHEIGYTEAKVWFPKMDPDATHRQIQSITGLHAMKIASPKEVRALVQDTFGTDWPEEVPDPSEWEDFLKVGAPAPAAAPIAPGQGKTGQMNGQLADGDHELRDENQSERGGDQNDAR